MNLISSSYGNDSCALIQWAHENALDNVHVVFVDTGWARDGWLDRVDTLSRWAESLGFAAHNIKAPIGFQDLIRQKSGFPSNRYQWCSMWLKGLPFVDYADKLDSDRKAKVIIGKRRAESTARKDTPEFIESSDKHGGRMVWHPLYKHSDDDRNALLLRACIEPLPHRSDECFPCVNAGKADLRRLTANRIEMIEALEGDAGHPMFRAKKCGDAQGIRQVVQWAYSNHGTYQQEQMTMFNECSEGWCGS